MLIVGLVGPKGSGKDTSADLLKTMGISSGKLSFAGPMKDIISKVFGIPMRVLIDPVLKEKELKEPVVLTSRILRQFRRECESFLDPLTSEGTLLYRTGVASIAGIENRIIKTPRYLMQFMGSEFIRERLFKNWHIEAAFQKKVMAKLDQDGLYCVTDIRFVNEYEFLKNKFGDKFLCYYVARPEAEEHLLEATHESELGVSKIKALLPEEAVITNDGDVEDLKKTLKGLNLRKVMKAAKTDTSTVKSSKFKFKKV